MSLINKIIADKMLAKKAKQSVEVSILGVLQGEVELQSSKTIKKVVDGVKRDVKREPLTDAEIIKIASKLVDSNDEVIKNSSAGRDVTVLHEENEILNRYIPVVIKYSNDEVTELIKSKIAELPESDRTIKNMGRIMGTLSVHSDKLDMKVASGILRSLLM